MRHYLDFLLEQLVLCSEFLQLLHVFPIYFLTALSLLRHFVLLLDCVYIRLQLFHLLVHIRLLFLEFQVFLVDFQENILSIFFAEFIPVMGLYILRRLERKLGNSKT